MATRHVLADLAEAAASAGLPLLDIESVGGVDAARRVEGGEQFDLVFLAEGALRRLAADGHVVGDSITPLLLSQTAVAVPSGSPEPAEPVDGAAFADADGVRAALGAASRIGYSTGPSGTALVALIESWGMTAELDGRLVQARPGIPVARAIGDGELDLGFQQLSELVSEPGVRILGTLPPDCAIDTVFAGAVATAASNAPHARELLDFFRSDAAAAIAERHSFLVP